MADKTKNTTETISDTTRREAFIEPVGGGDALITYRATDTAGKVHPAQYLRSSVVTTWGLSSSVGLSGDDLAAYNALAALKAANPTVDGAAFAAMAALVLAAIVAVGDARAGFS